MREFTKDFYDLLVGEYKGINLTRINDFEDFELKQIKDSVEPYYQSQVFKTSIDSKKLMVDIGFGGGFPILPMAKINPDCQFIGIETRGKKAKVVGEISSKLGLKNTKFLHKRIEEVLIDKPAVCTFKAVGKVNDFLNKIYTTEIIQVFFYKGPNFYELEYDQIQQTKKDWNIIEELEVDLPGVEKRYLIGFENKKPRKGLNILVKLSELT